MRVSFHPAALAEVEAAQGWYEERSIPSECSRSLPGCRLPDRQRPCFFIAAAASSPEGNCILFGRKATLQADAYEAAGQKDQAIAVLAKTVAAFPNPRLQQSLEGSREAPRADFYRTTRRGTRAFTAS